MAYRSLEKSCYCRSERNEIKIAAGGEKQKKSLAGIFCEGLQKACKVLQLTPARNAINTVAGTENKVSARQGHSQKPTFFKIPHCCSGNCAALWRMKPKPPLYWAVLKEGHWDAMPTAHIPKNSATASGRRQVSRVRTQLRTTKAANAPQNDIRHRKNM